MRTGRGGGRVACGSRCRRSTPLPAPPERRARVPGARAGSRAGAPGRPRGTARQARPAPAPTNGRLRYARQSLSVHRS
ncbi:hypothetical protein FXF51_03550 [Nonomuraea sp. PA05]|nr:hypothetical protein FXF51_03550 [Nonomuraea sp. PA05]